MKILLFFVIANVFALMKAAPPQPKPKPSASDWLNEIDNMMTQYLPKDMLAIQEHGKKYPPIEKDVTFWCVKPNQKDVQQVTSNDPNVASKLDLSKPIIFYIHSWLGLVLGEGIPFKNDAIKWARHGDSNACTVNWSRLAHYKYSTAATKHTKMVADATVNFMKFLVQHGMNVEQVSIAGFGVGAHIAGFIGAAFPEKKLAAIYGLDPAGPGFTIPADYGTSQRLDPTDAKYVQCIFTNQFMMGSGIDCGHGNFYLNGGMCQPGCGLNVTCSHERSFFYFNESLNPKRKFIGERCENAAQKLYLELLGQKCSDVTDRMGIHTARKTGRFFVKTNAESPFAIA